MARPLQSSTVLPLAVRTTLAPAITLMDYLIWLLIKSVIALLDRQESIALLLTHQTGVSLSTLGPFYLQLLLLLHGMLGLATSPPKGLQSLLLLVQEC